MPGSDRSQDRSILALARVIFAAIFGLIGYYQGVEVGQSAHAQNYANAHGEYAVDKIERACVGLNATLMRECIQDAIEASVEQQRAEKDLSAHQNMAMWAKWLLALTCVSTAVTAFGVWYVRRTLIQASETNVAVLWSKPTK